MPDQAAASPPAAQPNNQAPCVHRLTFFYVLALTLVALLSLAANGIVQSLIARQENEGLIINMAGRQRMLSQQLVKAALAMTTLADPSLRESYRQSLSQTLSDWQKAHQILRYGDPSRRISSGHSPELQALFERLEPDYRHMIESAQSLLRQAAPSQNGGGSEALAALLKLEPSFLQTMEAIVARYEQEYEDRITGLQHTENFLLGITLLTLGLEGFLIFRPITHAIHRNIAALTLAQSSLEEKNRQLDDALSQSQSAAKAKSVFLATMSHEIRTPMNGVIGMTSLLLDTPLNALQRDYVETIRSSGDSLLTIINDILDYSKIESGRFELEKHPFDLRHCVEETLDLLAPIAFQKQLELTCRLEDALPQVLAGDGTRLRQVLVNLVGNAIKFTPKGEVAIEGKLASSSPEGVRIHFSVRDTGIGIPPEKRDSLFQPFSQAHNTFTEIYGGSGLGLAICKRLVELMGGTIWIDPETVRGTTVHFTFNAGMTGEPAKARQALPAAAPHMAGKKALVVDDNPTNLRIISHDLSKLGILPVTFTNPRSALGSLQGGSWPDVIITDMQMPGLDGIDFTLEVRTLEAQTSRKKRTPVLMLSSTGPLKSDQRVLAASFCGILNKPVRQHAFFQEIARILSGQEEAPANLDGYLQPPSHTHFGRENPLKILVVEDNPTNQKVMRRLLENLGYRPDLVSRGAEALEACGNVPYDLVLMDIQMPGLDGHQTTRLLREKFKEHGPAVVAVTANVLEEDRQSCFDSGMADYLPKPVTLDSLKKVLARAAQLPRPSLASFPAVQR
jgi:signal transduction histidine kinase/CheY-like chemotaxis protein